MRITNIEYHRIIAIEYMLCFFSGLGTALCIFAQEMKGIPELWEIWNQALHWYSLFCTLATCFGLYTRYVLYLDWFKSRGLLTEFETVQSTGWWKQLSYEIIIVIIAPLPYLEDYRYHEYVDMFHADISYTYNEILLSFMLFRVYIFVRYALVASQFMSPRSKRICSINGCEADLMFAMKSIMKQRPYLAIWISLLVTIFLFGYQLKLFEGPISEASN